jgi:hypothetical protein
LYRLKLNFFLSQIAILIGLLQNPEKDGRRPKGRYERGKCDTFDAMVARSLSQDLHLGVFNTDMQLFILHHGKRSGAPHELYAF